MVNNATSSFVGSRFSRELETEVPPIPPGRANRESQCEIKITALDNTRVRT